MLVDIIATKPRPNRTLEIEFEDGIQGLRAGLALIVMLAMAVGRIRQQQHPEHLRSLVWSA